MAPARSERPSGWFAPALALVALVTALRLLALWFDRADLFVDEAQYWLWGTEPAFGYYSKPPMIAWVIRAATEICGTGTACIRAPAPIFHGATALILGAIAASLTGRRSALVVVAGYLTLPMVALGSLLISTDTILFPFMAAALWAWLACLRGAGPGVAVAGGIALGLGFLSKYAAVYYLLCASMALAIRPRPTLAQALAFLAGFALAAAPNVVWNLVNGAPTLEHTLDNADWVRDPGHRAGLNLAGLAEFLASQFAVFGPVAFAALLALAATWRRRDAAQRRLLLFALPILAIVCIQALLSRAYANWAATAYLAGSLLVFPWLARTSRAWTAVSFWINGALSLILPLLVVFPYALMPGGHPAAERYLGRAEVSGQIIAAAGQAGLGTVVSGNRDLLADLFYTGRDSGLTFRASPPQGRAPNHYALRYPFEGTGPALFADTGAPPCPDTVVLGRIEPTDGAWRGKTIGLWRIPAGCFSPG